MAKEKIKCPECGSINIEELFYSADGLGAAKSKPPKEERHGKYRCVDCGLIFYESNLQKY
jgi:DNA-directed RNA polymerase subunit RPC12/RpoP